jgi:16S rRNA (uracil1498-N3)-methyltransferase
MLRRIHTRKLHVGKVALTPEQVHHVRKVLRLADGETIEVFDDAGNVAAGVLRFDGSTDASVHVETIATAGAREFSLIIAAAVPKGERADWMIEKLSELGVDAFVPLAAARSVVLPEGRNKYERWERIATESAKQSRRTGTMRIDRLTPVDAAMGGLQAPGWVCSTTGNPTPLNLMLQRRPAALTVFIGPEGGWSEEELAGFADAGITSIGLTQTALRVETAAIAAASVLLINRPA